MRDYEERNDACREEVAKAGEAERGTEVVVIADVVVDEVEGCCCCCGEELIH